MPSECDRRPIIRAPFLIALLIAAVVGGAIGTYRYMSARPVLAGESHALLGEVWLDLDDETGALHGSAEHVYYLTNRTRRALKIADVRSSCGCTVPSIDVGVVEPGEVVEVAAAVHLDRPGVRTAEVFVHFEDGRVQTLSLEARGRSRSPLRADPHRVALALDRAVTVRVIAEVWDESDGEPRVTVHAPPGIEAKLANWSLWRPAHPQRGTPAMWAGPVHVSVVEEDALTDDAALEIVLDDEHLLRVPLLAPHGAEPSQ